MICGRGRKIVDRQQSHDALFQAYFDKPEFRNLMLDWLTKTLYDGIRGGEGRTA